MSDFFSYLDATSNFVRFYGASIRAPMFTGFLTLTGFLFTVKTFLVVRMQDVYGDNEYQEWILGVSRRYNKSMKIYDSMRRLGRWLFVAIILACTTSALQLTVGLIDSRWAVWLAMGAAAITGIYFIVTLVVIRGAIRKWVDYLEEKAEKAFAAKQAKLASQAATETAAPTSPAS